MPVVELTPDHFLLEHEGGHVEHTGPMRAVVNPGNARSHALYLRNDDAEFIALEDDAVLTVAKCGLDIAIHLDQNNIESFKEHVERLAGQAVGGRSRRVRRTRRVSRKKL